MSTLLLLFKEWIMLFTFLSMGSEGSLACPTGWFGTNCSYQCHCKTSVNCSTSGECPGPDRCADGYFGPACQYYDIAVGAVDPTPLFVKDNNESTCNTDSTSKLIELYFPNPITLTWLRLELKSPRNLQQFDVLIDGRAAFACSNRRDFDVNPLTIDVSCDYMGVIYRLAISGSIAALTCSVRVSGGRNLALKQMANMSSVMTPFSPLGQPSAAVDGNINTDSNSSCAASRFEYVSVTYTVKFYRLVSLVRVKVYGKENFEQWLKRFKLTAYNGKDIVYEITDTNYVSISYDLTTYSRDYVNSLVITGNDFSTNMLIICEVQAFGEEICLDYTYGLGCSKVCTCKPYEYCHEATGLCAQSCADGYYGLSCTKPCSPRCIGQLCSPAYGTCQKCPAGTMGHNCTEACPAGMYGKSCKRKCSSNCNDACNAVNGSCTCTIGFNPPDCTDCIPGRYGSDCTKRCSTLCQQRLCDREEGDCFNCTPPRTGPSCEECPERFYGPSCTDQCVSLCSPLFCDNLSGKCRKCVGNLVEPLCQECKNGTYGVNCANNCSVVCANGLCHNITGACFKCAENRQGPGCEDCMDGYYGLNCTKRCAEYCVHNKCDRVNGKCLACDDIHIGSYCTECIGNLFGPNCSANCPENCESQICDDSTGFCMKCKASYGGLFCTEGNEIISSSLQYVYFLVSIPIGIILILCIKRRPVSKSISWHSEDYSDTYEDDTDES